MLEDMPIGKTMFVIVNPATGGIVAYTPTLEQAKEDLPRWSKYLVIRDGGPLLPLLIQQVTNIYLGTGE